MLATCVQRGLAGESYLDPAHPCKRGVREVISELSGDPIDLTPWTVAERRVRDLVARAGQGFRGV
ncbi:hypothetical protein GCM10020366_71050 [Saccharopolyspora gregorii]|uniref:Uncharacterized protein n=1 Tax=Saccharopolyspora gregorii TaxID=33914 RepID=A0ABP6S311_9PSEU